MYFYSDERLWEEWEWQDYFADGLKKQGEELYEKGVGEISVDEDQKGGSLEIRKFLVTAKQLPATYEECKRTQSKYGLNQYVSCDCAAYEKSRKCKHMYAFLRKWEDTVFSFRKDEPLNEYEKRMEEYAKKRKESPMAPLFADLEVNPQCYLTPWGVLSSYSLYAQPEDIQRAGEVLAKEKGPEVTISFGRTEYGKKMLLSASMTEGEHKAEMSFSHGSLGYIDLETSCTCNINTSGHYFNKRLCSHQLILLHHLWEYILRENPTEESVMEQMQEPCFVLDPAGERRGDRHPDQISPVKTSFLEEMERREAVQNAALLGKEIEDKKKVKVEAINEKKESAETGKKNKEVSAEANLCSLLPEISISGYDIRLSFRLMLPGGKSYALRNLPNFLNAYDNKRVLELSKTASADFSKLRLDKESNPYLRYIYLNMESMRRINEMINSSHSFYYAQKHTANYGYTSYVPIDFETLDAFYELAGERNIAIAGTKESFHVGGKAEISYFITTEKDASGKVVKRKTQIEDYRIMEGYVHTYLILSSRLCRITTDDLAVLKRIRARNLNRMTIGKGQESDWNEVILPNLQKISMLKIIMQE